MTQKELCAMEVPSADNSVLYLWTTAPKLLEGLEVMSAWGFTYKSQAVWDKQKIGMGYWFRGQHEILLVGTKGKFSPPEQKHRRSSVFEFARGKHSKKPDEIRELIKEWFPDVDRVELFCRYPTVGWDVWGNEVECTAELPCAV
jgi:N6-adenosine-specific RNA methylase IME4